jgi:hypothetical protein
VSFSTPASWLVAVLVYFILIKKCFPDTPGRMGPYLNICRKSPNHRPRPRSRCYIQPRIDNDMEPARIWHDRGCVRSSRARHDSPSQVMCNFTFEYLIRHDAVIRCSLIRVVSHLKIQRTVRSQCGTWKFREYCHWYCGLLHMR